MFTVRQIHIDRQYRYNFDKELLYIEYPAGNILKVDLNVYFESCPIETYGNLIMEFLCAPYLPSMYNCDYTLEDVNNVLKSFTEEKLKSSILAYLYMCDEEICYYTDEEKKAIRDLENNLRNIMGETNYKIAIMEYKLKGGVLL